MRSQSVLVPSERQSFPSDGGGRPIDPDQCVRDSVAMVALLCCAPGLALAPLAPHWRHRPPTCPVSHGFLLQDQDKEYVGFATLPNQVHRKSVKKGFDFTLMVAGTSRLLIGTRETFWKPPSLFLSRCSSEGESGLGKSTLVNSLFLTDLYKDRKLLNAEG